MPKLGELYCYFNNDGYVYGIATHVVNGFLGIFSYSGGTRMHDTLFGMIISAREASAQRWE